MSQQNNFGSGFILGSIVGGVVGGVLGTVFASRKERVTGIDTRIREANEVAFGTEESIELARNGLETKIAQLNLAIDDVKEQLGSVKAPGDRG